MRRFFRDTARPSRRVGFCLLSTGQAQPITNDIDQEPGSFWNSIKFGADTLEVHENEPSQPSVSPLGVLAPDGTPLVRYVIPARTRPIGFVISEPLNEEEYCEIAYITTEAEIRISKTAAGNIDYTEEDYEE